MQINKIRELGLGLFIKQYKINITIKSKIKEKNKSKNR